jgi:diaminopimelate epimerase
MKLAKWHGLGNDYLVVEQAALPGPLTTGAITTLCDRHSGVGSDGILLLCPKTGAIPDAVARMRIFNPDGSESEMCGNGIRIFARYLAAAGTVAAREFTIETLAGPIRPRLLDSGEVRVDMGRARFESPNIDLARVERDAPDGVVDSVLEVPGGISYRFTFVDVGNPHCVIQVDDPSDIDLPAVGGAIERHMLFPNRVNVEFIHTQADGSVRMRVWERGVGETQACGTGATAVGAAAVRLGLASSPVRVHLTGGDLLVEVRGPDAEEYGSAAAGPGATNGTAGAGLRIFMTGPAEKCARAN